MGGGEQDGCWVSRGPPVREEDRMELLVGIGIQASGVPLKEEIEEDVAVALVIRRARARQWMDAKGRAFVVTCAGRHCYPRPK